MRKYIVGQRASGEEEIIEVLEVLALLALASGVVLLAVRPRRMEKKRQSVHSVLARIAL